MEEYSKQIDFEEKLEQLFETSGHGPSPEYFDRRLRRIERD